MSASAFARSGGRHIDNQEALSFFHRNRPLMIAASSTTSVAVVAAGWPFASHGALLGFLALHQAAVALMVVGVTVAKPGLSGPVLASLCAPQAVLSGVLFADQQAARSAEFILAVGVVLFAFAAGLITMMGPWRRALRAMLVALFAPYTLGTLVFGHPGFALATVIFIILIGGAAVARSADLFDELITLRRADAERARHAEEIAVVDSLTGLTNRYGLSRFDARPIEREAIGLFIDLDRFKEVNDELGHRAGDEVLQATAERLRACVRPSDTVARLGGDEFFVILWADQPLPVLDVADRIRARLETPIVVSNGVAEISASIGVASQQFGPLALDALIETADEALYMAKSLGRNQTISSSVHLHPSEQGGPPDPDRCSE